MIILVSFVGEVEKQLKEADDCFKQCDIEIRMLPSSQKAAIVTKVEALRKEFESKKRQVNNLKTQVERNDLLGGAAVIEFPHSSREASRELKRSMEDQLTSLERLVFCPFFHY